MMRQSVWLALLLLALFSFLLISCGGGDGKNTTPIQLTIEWAERSRQVSAPSSALSAIITLTRGEPAQTGLQETINRRADPAAYTQDYVSSHEVEPGVWQVMVQFYAQADGEGPLVGVAQQQATIAEDGTGIGTITTEYTIASVELPAQQVYVGQQKDLVFTAKNNQGSTVAVTPGSALFEVTAGGDKLTVTRDGQATGVAVGDATVQVEVDGKTGQGTVTVAQAPAPVLAMVKPTAGQVIRSSTVDVEVQTTNFTIVNKPGQPNAFAEGHVHWWLDQDPTQQGAGNGTPQYTATFQLTNVQPGQHRLWVELRNNDHSSLDPRVIQDVSFTVEAPLSQQFRSLLPAGQQTATIVGPDTCKLCHNSKHTDWAETRHSSVGTTCESCHGPGSAHVDPPSGQARKDLILTYPKITNGIVCGQCHEGVHDQWKQSKHDEILTEVVERANSTCSSCHSGLQRLEILENGEAATTEKLTEIAEQTVNQVPYSAVCATCHNPHKRTGKLNADGEERQLRHAVSNMDTALVDPGSPVDEYVRFDHICAQCHNGRGANPADTALQSGTSRPNMHDSNQYNMLLGFAGWTDAAQPPTNVAHPTIPGQCSHCHMMDGNHSTHIDYTACQPCHSNGAALADQTEDEITADLTDLRTRMERWATATYGNNPAYEAVDDRLIPYLWDYSALISETATGLGLDPNNLGIPTTHQADLPIELKRARHNYYFVVRDGSYGVHNEDYAKHLIAKANENLTAIGAPTPSRARLTPPQMRRIVERDRQRARLAEVTAWVTEE